MTTFRLLRQFERQSRCALYPKALAIGLARQATRRLMNRIRLAERGR